MKVLIIIPAYNEARIIASVIKAVKQAQPSASILVIDDGSDDLTSEEAKATGALVIRHMLNRGLGGAIGTGLAFAKKYHFDIAVTIDADGQHDPQDIAKAIEPVCNHQADVVIGSRLLAFRYAMPIDRRLINRIANAVTFILFGVRTTDSQSGFRVFGSKAIQSLSLRTDRMEVSSEIFTEIKRLHLKVVEVPITVRYTQYSLSKGQTNRNMWQVGYKLVLRLFR